MRLGASWPPAGLPQSRKTTKPVRLTEQAHGASFFGSLADFIRSPSALRPRLAAGLPVRKPLQADFCPEWRRSSRGLPRAQDAGGGVIQKPGDSRPAQQGGGDRRGGGVLPSPTGGFRFVASGPEDEHARPRPDQAGGGGDAPLRGDGRGGRGDQPVRGERS